MRSLYLYLARHSKFVKKIFLLLYIASAIAFVAGIWLYGQKPELKPAFNSLGRYFGQASTVLLLVALTPGILSRLKILKTTESTLLLFRRQFGVTAFFMAMLHLGYISWIRRIASGQNPLPSVFTYQQTGFVALSVFLVLWILSNDFSMRTFGPIWKLLQRLGYVAAIALLFHIYDAQSNWWMPVGVYLGLEVISWLAVIVRKIFIKKPTS